MQKLITNTWKIMMKINKDYEKNKILGWKEFKWFGNVAKEN